MTSREEYLRVQGFPDYIITNLGAVYSTKYKRLQLLKQIPNNRLGYLRVYLREGGKTTTKYVHRLVAEHFTKERNDTVNHKDLDVTNNVVSNLEWLSYRDNNIHARLNGNNLEGIKNGYYRHGKYVGLNPSKITEDERERFIRVRYDK